MRRASWSCLVLAISAVSIPTRADDSKSRPNKDAAFAPHVQSLTDVILKRHIDPPTRQQMILDGTRAVYRAAGELMPRDTSRRVSGLATNAQVGEFLSKLQIRFGKKVRTEDVFVAGLLNSLPGGARLVSAEELKVQGQLNANRYVGTGIVLATDAKTKRPSIRKPFYNGPAWKAGIKAGDLILAIDGVTTERMPLGDVIRRLRGERGSTVVMKVRQPNSKDVRTLTLTRDVAFIPTVEGHRELPAGKWQFHVESARQIAYVRINRIGSSTLHELRQVDARLRGTDVRGIVLDLRYGGGTLHDMVLVADALLDGGVIGRVRGTDVKTHTSTRGMLFAKLPMAVLVGRSTTSGYEFLAAALQDNRRAIVVGQPTPGDGFVRSSVEVPGSKGAVIMAVGELQRGDGTPLRGVRNSRFDELAPRIPQRSAGKSRPGGVLPDHRVSIPENRRLALMRAYSYTTPGLRKPGDDPLLAKAVEALNARRIQADSKAKTSGKEG